MSCYVLPTRSFVWTRICIGSDSQHVTPLHRYGVALFRYIIVAPVLCQYPQNLTTNIIKSVIPMATCYRLCLVGALTQVSNRNNVLAHSRAVLSSPQHLFLLPLSLLLLPLLLLLLFLLLLLLKPAQPKLSFHHLLARLRRVGPLHLKPRRKSQRSYLC